MREPPFYALKCSSDFLHTIGGIKINERMEVVSKAGKSIPGLYAAGVITGGWQGETYCVHLLGSARGFSCSVLGILPEKVRRSFFVLRPRSKKRDRRAVIILLQ